MSLTKEQKLLLNEPLDPAFVKGRNQGGTNVSYVEGVHSIGEANRIFDFDGWSYKILRRERVQEELKVKNPGDHGQWNVGYICDVEVTVGDITRMDVGFGNGQNKDLGAAHEFAVKEAATDALKRALRTFGNTFGLALYDKTRKNVGKKSTQGQQLEDERNNQVDRTERIKLYSRLLGWYDEGITPQQRTLNLNKIKDRAKVEGSDYIDMMEVDCKELGLL